MGYQGPIRNYSVGPEGVAQRGQAREGPRGDKVGSSGANRKSGVQGRKGARGDSVGNDGPPPEREWGVQGYWYLIGVVEGVLSCG